jgi:Putative prokaryotic signal transducing protein
MSDAPKLVRVAVAPDPVTAQMWQEALRRAGVMALLRNLDPLSVAWGTPAAPFSCELLVNAADVDAARLILDDIAEPEEG